MYKVLIVEDDPMVAMINEQYVIKNKGFEVVGRCRDGHGALDFVSANHVDLMILDVYMPRMDGFETLRRIRSLNIPLEVIMVTAANGRESLEEALHLGIVDYLVKPFTFERFSAALEKFASKHSAMRDIGTLNQQSIDFIVDSARKRTEDAPQKGIQERTLHVILDYLTAHTDTWFTGDEIATAVGLTVVTVRRYMNYLAESGKAESKMDYETGGRPCVRYRVQNGR